MDRAEDGHEGPLLVRGFPSELDKSSEKVINCLTSDLEILFFCVCYGVNYCSLSLNVVAYGVKLQMVKIGAQSNDITNGLNESSILQC